VYHQKWLKGFKICCMSSAVVETDDEMVWHGIEEDGIVRSVRKINLLTEDRDSDTKW